MRLRLRIGERAMIAPEHADDTLAPIELALFGLGIRRLFIPAAAVFSSISHGRPLLLTVEPSL
jgi:hypothetical protein